MKSELQFGKNEKNIKHIAILILLSTKVIELRFPGGKSKQSGMIERNDKGGKHSHNVIHVTVGYKKKIVRNGTLWTATDVKGDFDGWNHDTCLVPTDRYPFYGKPFHLYSWFRFTSRGHLGLLCGNLRHFHFIHNASLQSTCTTICAASNRGRQAHRSTISSRKNASAHDVAADTSSRQGVQMRNSEIL